MPTTLSTSTESGSLALIPIPFLPEHPGGQVSGPALSLPVRLQPLAEAEARFAPYALSRRSSERRRNLDQRTEKNFPSHVPLITLAVPSGLIGPIRLMREE